MFDERAWFERGISDEQRRIIAILKKHQWFEKGEQDEIIAMLDGSWQCNCDGCAEKEQK